MKQNENAINYIKTTIQNLDSAIKIEEVNQPSPYQYYFHLDVNGQPHVIIFDEAFIEDFEIALTKYKGTSYCSNLENHANFKIYLSLGEKALIPHFRISKEILNEKREWAKDVAFDVTFGSHLSKIFYEGLKKLSRFLEITITSYLDLNLTEVKEDKSFIDSLKKYYDENRSFTTRGASVKSLGFLKAAALCEIIDKENIKEKEKQSRVLQELDKEIYFIASNLREPPFLEMSLPESAYEYANYIESGSKKIKTIRKKTGNKRKTSPRSKVLRKGWNIKEEKFIPLNKSASTNPYMCFVIMPMGKEGTEERELNDAVYDHIIKPCVENSGFNISCFHSGFIGDTGAIPKQIIENLYKSDIVVADLRGLNPNVMWELGVRHAFLKRSIIIYSDENQINKTFDISIYRGAKYNIDGESNQDFFKLVSSFIQNIITDPRVADNPVWEWRPIQYKTPSNFTIRANIDQDKTNCSSYFQGGNYMKVNFYVMFDNESPEKNYIMQREFLLLNSNRELLGRLAIPGELPSDLNKEIGYVNKVFQKGFSLPEDSPLLYEFEAHINLDNIKKKINLKERDDLILSCNFTPREGSKILAGELIFPVIFSR